MTTPRLLLTTLTRQEARFIKELVNTPGWLRYIGNRNVNDLATAKVYIQRLLDNPGITYWIVKLKATGASIGVITLIKRDYLPDRDIGFAFLPGFEGNGYAFEAASAVLDALLSEDPGTRVLATTMKDNQRSAALLTKLGLKFEREIEINGNSAMLYKL